MSLIGQSLPRREDDALLRGRGRFADDLAPREAAHLVFLRSPVAAGRIVRLDWSAAAAMPGVLAVLDADALAAAGVASFAAPHLPSDKLDGQAHLPDYPCLAKSAVHHVGQPILALVAETAERAQDAAESVVLEIDAAPGVTDLSRAATGPAVWPDRPGNRIFRLTMGDADAVAQAMAQAAHRVSRRLSVSRVTAAPMEPRSALATWDGVGFTLTCGTQAPHRLAAAMARQMGAPVRLAAVRCGGSFGMRNGALPEYAPLLAAARVLDRPLRWTATRSESFLADPHAREQIVEATLALDAQGNFLALGLQIVAGVGAFAGNGSLTQIFNNLPSVAGVYRLPAIHAEVEGLHLNTQTLAAYRGAGRPEATLIIERMIDLAARQTGLDRIDLRRRNMIRPQDLPHRTPLGHVYDSGDFPARLDEALAAADLPGFAARRAEAQARGRLRGLGVACCIEIAGGPPGAPLPEQAGLRLSAAGGVMLLGTGDAGQGHATTFAQIAAEALGLPPAWFTLVSGDTHAVPRGTGTFGSRSVAAAGSALRRACADALAELRPQAARLLDCEAGALEFAEGVFAVPGTNRRMTLLSLLEKTGLTVETARFEATDGPSYPNGCHVAEVEIDPETGHLGLCRYLAVEDIGTVINPMLAHGQLMGGVAQGVGQALMEAIRHDPDTGQPLTGSFMDYAMPRAGDLPFIKVVSSGGPTAMNALGSKGAGEAGTVGALSVLASAIADALAPLGVDHVDMPATPEAIWKAIRDARGQAITSSVACSPRARAPFRSSCWHSGDRASN